MFTFKKNYFIIIQKLDDINLKNFKINRKIAIIYRNNKETDSFEKLLIFRKQCKAKKIKFLIANNAKLAVELKSDGLYLSASNKSFKSLNYKNRKITIIGSAHNYKEINLKEKQGCKFVLISKLFRVSYDKKAEFLGVVKFNNLINFHKKIIPLGGINEGNLKKLKIIRGLGFAIMSEIKKKPAISNRLF